MAGNLPKSIASFKVFSEAEYGFTITFEEGIDISNPSVLVMNNTKVLEFSPTINIDDRTFRIFYNKTLVKAIPGKTNHYIKVGSIPDASPLFGWTLETAAGFSTALPDFPNFDVSIGGDFVEVVTVPNNDITSLQSLVSSHAATIAAQATAITSMQSQITSILGANTAQDTAIAGVVSINTAQSSAITAIQGVNTSQDSAIAGVVTVNDSQATDITAIQGVNTTQAAEIDDLQSQIDAIETSGGVDSPLA